MIKKHEDRSPFVVAGALVVGMAFEMLIGPATALVGAAVAATVAGLAFHYHDHHVQS